MLSKTFSISSPFSAFKISERHSFLLNTIGAFKKEEYAVIKVWWFLIGVACALIIGTIFEGVCFFLYNNAFHPFNKILETSKGKQ